MQGPRDGFREPVIERFPSPAGATGAIGAGLPVTLVTGGMSPFQALPNTLLLVDATPTTPIVIKTPAPLDRALLQIKDWKGQAPLNPILVQTLSATVAIENPNNNGNYAATAAVSTQGASPTWQFVSATNQWIEIT